MTRILGAAALVLVSARCADDESGVLLASASWPRATIVLAERAAPAEATAARELGWYLGKVARVEFRVVGEESAPASGTRIFVGKTRFAAGAGVDRAWSDADEWRIRTVGRDLVLVGGSPRGTLYSVYRFLEDEIGVRWWNAFEELVPERRRLAVPPVHRSGVPAFSYRDCHILDGPRAFCARSRLNGTATALPAALGGSIAIGPRGHTVHNLHHYVPPQRYFADHPEYFSLVRGRRVDTGQLCLTNPHVLDLVVRGVRSAIDASRADVRGREADPPGIFDVSPNDWAGWCECARCQAEVSESRRSGQWIRFVNRIADAVAAERPDVRVSTLAYYTTFHPPETVRARDNVIVRFSCLQWRDFSKPLQDPANRESLEAFLGWRRAARHLWTWDYAVTYGEYYEIPLPVLRTIASDLRFYLQQDVEGVFYQTDYPVSADLRDLKVWVLLKLIEDPSRDVDTLVREFTDGYYGAAGEPIRRYVSYLEEQASSEPMTVRMEPDPDDYPYLHLRFFREVDPWFREATEAVRGLEDKERRVRHARLSLDRAALAVWPGLLHELAVSGPDLGPPLRRSELEHRCRTAWNEQLELRVHPGGFSAGAADDNVPDCDDLGREGDPRAG
jgi:hypothetical protein